MKSNGCKTVYDEETSTCYSWVDSLWYSSYITFVFIGLIISPRVGYDNSRALAKKLKLFDQLNLRGAAPQFVSFFILISHLRHYDVVSRP